MTRVRSKMPKNQAKHLRTFLRMRMSCKDSKECRKLPDQDSENISLIFILIKPKTALRGAVFGFICCNTSDSHDLFFFVFAMLVYLSNTLIGSALYTGFRVFCL